MNYTKLCDPVKCKNHPITIIDIDRMIDFPSLANQLIEKDPNTKLYYGCIHYDIITSACENYENPVSTLREDFNYDLLKEAVDDNIISGTYYRGTNYDINNLKIGYIMDYERLSSWSSDIFIAKDFWDENNPIILKIKISNVKGLDLCKNGRTNHFKEIILSHYKFKIIEEEQYSTFKLLTVEII